jgi:hypothetical protein
VKAVNAPVFARCWGRFHYVESLIQQKDSVPAWEAKRRLKAKAAAST